MTKSFIANEDYFKKKYDDGALFVLEKYIDRLPENWFECVMFISSNGLKEHESLQCAFFSDEESKRVFDLLARDYIELFVVTDKIKNGHRVVWDCLVVQKRFKETENKEPEAVYLGGESLRRFCDEKNIYYQTSKTPEGKLVSGTKFKWQKNDGEDCRIPTNGDAIDE